jgi:hypothetical protein
MHHTEGFSRREVESKLVSMSDYVKLDFLQKCLDKTLDFDTRKFVLETLAGIYEDRAMFREAARLLRNSSEINATQMQARQALMRSCELFIRSGEFEESEISFHRALSHAELSEKARMQMKKKSMYMFYAQECLDKEKRRHAMLAYEKVMRMNLDGDERLELRERLMDLYDKLGKVKEYLALKNS